MSEPIHFELAGGANPLITFPVRFGDSGPHLFALDSGSVTVVVSPTLATRLGLAPGETRQALGAGGLAQLTLSRVASLQLGDERVEDLGVAITADVDAIGRVIGAPLAGILGYSVLRHFRVTIDYARREMTLSRAPASAAHGPDATSVPLRLASPRRPIPLVDVFLGDAGPLPMILDTGASTTVVTPEIAERLEIVADATTSITAAGGTRNVGEFVAASVRIGGATVSQVPAAIMDMRELNHALEIETAGIIGYSFLRHFHVTLDYPGEVLVLDRPAAAAAR